MSLQLGDKTNWVKLQRRIIKTMMKIKVNKTALDEIVVNIFSTLEAFLTFEIFFFKFVLCL